MVSEFQHALFWTRRSTQKCVNDDPLTFSMLENDLSRRYGAHAILSREGKARHAFQHRTFTRRWIAASLYELF